MQINIPVSDVPSTGYPLSRLEKKHGQERGEALSRLAVGLRAEQDSPADDERLILTAIADAILSATE